MNDEQKQNDVDLGKKKGVIPGERNKSSVGVIRHYVARKR